MAKASTPHLLRGKIGNLIFRVRDGKQFVHLAPEPHQERKFYKRRLRSPSFRSHVHAFAGASRIACEIYRQDLAEYRPMLRPYTHNLLAARLKKAAHHHMFRDFTGLGGPRTFRVSDGPQPRLIPLEAQAGDQHMPAYCIRDARAAFLGLDLSHPGAPARHVAITTRGPQHCPDAIHIAGLHEAAAKVPVRGNGRLELRIHVRQTAFSERKWSQSGKMWTPRHQEEAPVGNAMNQPSAWIPAEALPSEGIRIPLPAWEAHARFLTFVVIEWREIRAVGDRVVPHHGHAVARIVAVHGTAEDFAQAGQAPPLPHPTHKGPHYPHVIQPSTDWRKDPRAFIEEAIVNIRT